MVDAQRRFIHFGGRGEPVIDRIRGERGNVESVGRGKFKQLREVEHGYVKIVERSHGRHFVLSELRLGLQKIHFGYLAGCKQLLAPLKLHFRQTYLFESHTVELTAVERLKILGYDIERDVVLGLFELFESLHHRRACIVEISYIAQSLEEGQTQPHVPAEIGRVTARVGVLCCKRASESPRLVGSCLHLRQEAVLGFGHTQFTLLGAYLPAFHREVVGYGVADAAVETPCFGTGCQRGRQCYCGQY